MGRRVGLLLFMLLLVSTMVIPWQTDAAKKVSIFINDAELFLDQSPILEKGRTYVPLRGVFESLDATVDWKASTNEVVVNKDGRKVIVKIGSSSATINGINRVLDAPPFIRDSRTYVPFRFISEAIGADVEWDVANHAVRISMEGVTPQPKQPEVETKLLGKTESALISQLGQPKQKTVTEYGFLWSSFHNQYHNYALAGIADGKVVAFYSNDNTHIQNYGLSTSDTKNNVRQKLGQPMTTIQKGNTIYEYKEKNGGWDLFDVDGGYLTVFYDTHKGTTVTSIFHVKKDLENKKAGYYGTLNNQVRDSFEQNLFEITNALRVREGIHSLQWDDKAAVSARKHSEDMASNDYFAHTNLNGLSPFDRMTRDGISYSYAGENLAMGQFNAIFAHEGLMNSKGHRVNILSSEFTKLGTGVAFGADKRPYFTQKYFRP